MNVDIYFYVTNLEVVFGGGKWLQSIFESNVCIYNYEDSKVFEGKENIDAILDNLFELPEVTCMDNVGNVKGGRTLSTVHLYKTHAIPELLGFK